MIKHELCECLQIIENGIDEAVIDLHSSNLVDAAYELGQLKFLVIQLQLLYKEKQDD